MNVNNKDLSLLFYHYLCKVVGSEDVVRTKRSIFNAHDYARNSNLCCLISGGSKPEGLDLPGSDHDYLDVNKIYQVYESMDAITNYKHSRLIIPLIMDTSDTKPGYTKLKMFVRNQKHDMDYCYDIGNDSFLSSRLVRERLKYGNRVEHGPGLSNPSESLDTVIACHCKTWISQACKWIYRSRLSWPYNRLIETIIQHGVLFVPVGCKKSPHKDVEFRISFNVAERILVHSFSHVQLLCYALLKIILNHFIKPRHKDLLCSYFLKTIMFWVSEESIESTWQPHNLLRCFDQCFKRLVYCVTYSTCLHYFIPELDLFEDRFSESEHEELTRTLQGLYTVGWQCVLQTDLLCSFKFLIQQSPTEMVPSVSALPLLFYIISTRYTSVYGSINFPGNKMYAIILSIANKTFAQNIPVNTYHVTNKQRYRNYRKCLSHLLQGLHHDAVSGWLLLASFFYTHKQYLQCLYILNYCLHKCTPDKILLDPNMDVMQQHKFNIEMQQHVKHGFLRSCQQRVIHNVMFMEESFIMPMELSAIVGNIVHFVPPVVFGHFLRCICLHRLNRKRDKMKALLDLLTTLKNMYFIPYTPYFIELSYKCYVAAKSNVI